jgi:sialate O-acetylesterase
MKIRFVLLAVMSVLACAIELVRADVKLPGIFGDHMVVQRGVKVPIWGTADAGEKVTVKAQGQEQSATADDKGKWRVVLDPIVARDPIEISVIGKNSIAIKDVLVGEVWVCSGQSNMSFSLSHASNGKEAVKSADHPKMRLFTVGRAYTEKPQEDVGGKWEVCTPTSAGEFSAVAYFFGVELQEKLDQPMGLIEPSWGGTRAEAWLPRETFDRLKLPYEPEWTKMWMTPTKADPDSNEAPRERPYQAPAALYNGMIAPIAGYAMRGVIWYQGETNTAYPADYRNVLGALISSWRAAWGQGDFPFLVVQLSKFRSATRDWATLRGSQAQVAKDLPGVGLVVTFDVGEAGNIHPKDKQTVGKRLALAAEKIAYGQDVAYSGPVFKAMKIAGGEVVVSFDHLNGGLVAKGGEVRGFEIAGGDGKFVPGKARIEGETVVVGAEGVAAPAAVRYGWANDPTCTLYNKADLPAVPFWAKGR